MREEVNSRLEMYLKRLDEHDIDEARDFSRKNPTRFASRIERFQHYLKNHETGGRFVSEAIEAKDRILGEWDVYAYRQAFDHAMAHPDDVAEVAQRLRDYLATMPTADLPPTPGATRSGGTRFRSPGSIASRCAAAKSSRASASTSPAGHLTWAW